jgi:hypothetical protein
MYEKLIFPKTALFTAESLIEKLGEKRLITLCSNFGFYSVLDAAVQRDVLLAYVVYNIRVPSDEFQAEQLWESMFAVTQHRSHRVHLRLWATRPKAW